MAYLVSAADRAAFKRCRRQWDFTATVRRRLQPRRAMGFDLDRGLRDALAIYYFPGMWDWDAGIVLPLVAKALTDSLGRQREAIAGDCAPSEEADAEWRALLARARLVLDRYLAWAPTVDRLSPVRVETDFEAIVPISSTPSAGWSVRTVGRSATPGGSTCWPSTSTTATGSSATG